MRTAALIAVGVLITVGVGWLAAEQHYDNCVTTANAAHPLGAPPEDFFDVAREDKFRQELRARREALDGCSRLPW